MSIKTVSGGLWSIAPDQWCEHYEPYLLPMYKKALELLQLNEDVLLLDAGCGAGLFSNLAIEKGAQVTGVDISPGLLDVARRRNRRNSFLKEDLESLPFADNSFHVVTALNCFQNASTVQAALGDAKRVLKSGGRLMIGTWDRPEVNDAAYILNAISSLMPAPQRGNMGPFSLSEQGIMEDICADAGLKVVYRTKLACPFLYHSIDDAVNGFLATGLAAAALNYARGEQIEEAIRRSLLPFHLTGNLYFLQNQFLLFIAEK